MTFQALLVSKDEAATAVLTPVLSGFGISAVCCSYTDAICKLTEQKFDSVIVDFDDPHSGALILQNVREGPSNRTITVALLGDQASVRKVFGEGANFILYKPIDVQHAEAGLRAATALIKRERRISYRVPVQAAIQIKLQDGGESEGILLDVSEDGIDILAAQPLAPGALFSARFSLPDAAGEIDAHGEIAWSNPNGEAGAKLVSASDNVRNTLKAWITAHAPEIPPQDPEPVTQCKLTDLSLGGCYVETESPFPERSGVTLCLKADDMETRASGIVRVMHPGFGMGIEFPSHTTDEQGQVANFIGFLSARPGTVPELLITPRGLASSNQDSDPHSADGEELDDPLLELLRRGESLSQEDFLRELRQQRNSEVAPA